MPRIELNFEAQVQQLRMTKSAQLIAGNRNYYYAVFDLDSTWADVENKKAAFIRGEDVWVMSLETGANSQQCKIPWEVMEREGNFGVGVFGGDRILTNLVTVKVDGGFLTEGEESLEPTVDWFKKVEELVLVGGKPGFSPTVKVYEGDGGHRIYITTASGVEEVFVPDGKNADICIATAGKTPAYGMAEWVAEGKAVCAIWPNGQIMWMQEAKLRSDKQLDYAKFSDGNGTVTVKPGSEWSEEGIKINPNLSAGTFTMTSLERLNSDYSVTMDFRLTGTSTETAVSDDRDEGLHIRPLSDSTNPDIDINPSNGRAYRYTVRLSADRGAQLTYGSNYYGDFNGVLRGKAHSDSAKHTDYAESNLPQSFEREKTYSLKLAKEGDTLKLKVWEAGTAEPDWQATYSNSRISEFHPNVEGRCEWNFEMAHQNKGTDDESFVVSNLVFRDAARNSFWNGASENEVTALEYFEIGGGSWGAYVSDPAGGGAMPISGGTFTGAAYAKSATTAAAQLRNTALVSADTNPTVNGQINWTYA